MELTPAFPAIRGIHHVKIAVSNLSRSLDFYIKVFGATRIAEADHKREDTGELYGHILDVPGLGTKLELRLNPNQAERSEKFDPLTIAVDDRSALKRWSDHLDQLEILHSPIITAIQAWILVFEDPDLVRLRLYTLETHGRDLKPDQNNEWL